MTAIPAHSQPGAPKLPPMPKPARSGLWQQVPPAIFPPILGLFGLGLGWRRAPEVFPVPREAGETILGAVSLLFLFALLAYLAKIVRRPSALSDDLRILPGRAGVSTASMAAMLFAATLLPYSPGLARGVLVAALAAHLLVIVLVARALWGAPLAQRRMTPVWHLTFVGPIVAGVAGAGLGWRAATEINLILSLGAAATIWGGSLVLLAKNPVPAPLRPTLSIHLSPAALLGIVAAALGHDGLALAFGWLSILIMAVLLLRLGYLVAAGFSPFWGAFTFPLAAFANLMLVLAPLHGGLYRGLGGGALVAASIAIPIIAFKVLRMWAAGSLAAKTNASRV